MKTGYAVYISRCYGGNISGFGYFAGQSLSEYEKSFLGKVKSHKKRPNSYKVRHRAAGVGKKSLLRALPSLSEKLSVVKHIKDEPSC